MRPDLKFRVGKEGGWKGSHRGGVECEACPWLCREEEGDGAEVFPGGCRGLREDGGKQSGQMEKGARSVSLPPRMSGEREG